METCCCQVGLNDQLLLYMERGLSKSEHAAVTKHLRECPLCAHEHGMLHSIVNQLSGDRDLLRTAQGFGACIPSAMLVALAAGESFSEARICDFEHHMQKCKSCRDEFDMLKRLY